jgi:hypothetical protein
VNILISRRPEWNSRGPARNAIDAWAATQFSKEGLGSLASYEVETVKIAPCSVVMLRRMMSDLAEAMEEAAHRDRYLPAEHLQWHALLAALRPVDPLHGGR